MAARVYVVRMLYWPAFNYFPHTDLSIRSLEEGGVIHQLRFQES